jgi:superfamily II RNA helicase
MLKNRDSHGGGAGFGELRDHAALDPGDLIRCFRQAIQVMRQTRQALSPDQADLKARLKATMAAMNRDEVDAEKQLRGVVEAAPLPPGKS